MASYIGFRDGGKTNEEGLHKELSRLFTGGNPLTSTPSSMQVVQRAAGANMSVDVSIGDIHILNPAGTYSYWGWIDAATNIPVTTADPSNTRIDVVYAYVDLTVVSSASNNNPGALKFGVYAGTPSGTPLAASDSTIQSFLGASTPFLKLATITLTAGLSAITNTVISDTRTSLALKVSTGATATSGWNNLLSLPSSVVANGNRSYTLTFNAVDITSSVSPGMRLRTTRTVAAPTQCTALNGTTQYYSKATPAGTTFTNNFAVSAWVKLASYTAGSVISRYNGTSGFDFRINSTGQVELIGYNGGSANFADLFSVQSIPLNKWVHVAAQMDMTVTTNSPTTNYVMIDGVDVPATVGRGGTNPTALVQAGNLEIGSRNAGTQLFPGKIAQAAIYGAKVTEATINTSKDQSLVGTETNLISAFTLSGAAGINDLNTTNANNLTANGGALSTTADAPFGGQANGIISSTLDFGIVQSSVFNINTVIAVQVAEGCTIPSSGGIAGASYSSAKTPYNFPSQRSKWRVEMPLMTTNNTGATLSTVYDNNLKLAIPAGEWRYGLQGSLEGSSTTAANIDLLFYLDTVATNYGKTPTAPEPAVWVFSANAATFAITTAYRESGVSLAALTTYTLYSRWSNGAGTITSMVRGDQGGFYIFAENAYL